MDIWNCEQLYSEIWEEPVSKVAAKYGISDVMLGKVCRQLSIPVPGRGYWARKAAGQKLSRPPPPALKQVPDLYRFKLPKQNVAKDQASASEPTDAEFLRVKEMESRTIDLASIQKRHKMVIASEKCLSGIRPNQDQILEPHGSSHCLAIRSSAGTLDRALNIMNANIVTLESEAFPVSVEQGVHGTSATIFGHAVGFAIFERLEVTGRREVGEGIWKKTVVDHAPTGKLELRLGDFTDGPKLRDLKSEKLENMLAKCVAGLMRLGRDQVLAVEAKRIREIEVRHRQEELRKLSEEIRKEDERVKELDEWVT